MAMPQRKLHRVGLYVPKERRPAPPVVDVPVLPVATDEDEKTERFVAVPVGRRTPPRLRKTGDDSCERVGPIHAVVPLAERPGAWTEDSNRRVELIPRTEPPMDGTSFASFKEAFLAAKEASGNDAREMLDPNDVPLEAKDALAAVEGELGDEIAELAGITAKQRVTIAEKGMRSLEGVLYFVKNGVPELAKTGLEFLNLDSKEKAYAALLEIIPTVSFWYAVTGKRVKFQEGKGLSQPEFEDIDKVDRALYAVGSVFFLGHVYSGIRHSLIKKGVFALARQGKIIAAARALIPEAAKLVGPTVARAQQYGIRQLTRDRSKSPVRSSQPEDRS